MEKFGGEKIENKKETGRRDFLKKLSVLAAGLALPDILSARKPGVETIQESQEGEKNPEREQIIHELFYERELEPNPGKNFSAKVDLWYKRYSGQDPEFDALELIYKKRLNKSRTEKKLSPINEVTISKELDEAWLRLTTSGDIEKAYKIIKEHNLPLDLLFLAITESHWKKDIKSRVGAAGPWQFMPRTAKEWGLKVNNKIDERLDVEKSTNAACKFLKYLYSKSSGMKNVSESDRWIWAFWAYNRGPGHVFGMKNRKTGKVIKQGDFFGTKGQVDKYFTVCANWESKNYAPKIFGVAKALQEKYEGKIEPKSTAKISKSAADILFEEYVTMTFWTNSDRVAYLNNVIGKYEEEGKDSTHTPEYIESAIDIITKEISNIVPDLTK